MTKGSLGIWALCWLTLEGYCPSWLGVYHMAAGAESWSITFLIYTGSREKRQEVR